MYCTFCGGKNIPLHITAKNLIECELCYIKNESCCISPFEPCVCGLCDKTELNPGKAWLLPKKCNKAKFGSVNRLPQHSEAITSVIRTKI